MSKGHSPNIQNDFVEIGAFRVIVKFTFLMHEFAFCWIFFDSQMIFYCYFHARVIH